jgi:hypothetical protein
MTPKEKAKELFKKLYQPIFDIDFGLDVSKDIKRYEAAKQCALIAVEELIEEENYREGNAGFWQEVKKEIELL